MLILTRRTGELIEISPSADVDPRTSVGELFAQGPIEIVVTSISHTQVKLGIHAHPGLRILRRELTVRKGD